MNTQYLIDASIELDNVLVEKEREYPGRFILATNILALDSESSR